MDLLTKQVCNYVQLNCKYIPLSVLKKVMHSFLVANPRSECDKQFIIQILLEQLDRTVVFVFGIWFLRDPISNWVFEQLLQISEQIISKNFRTKSCINKIYWYVIQNSVYYSVFNIWYLNSQTVYYCLYLVFRFSLSPIVFNIWLFLKTEQYLVFVFGLKKIFVTLCTSCQKVKVLKVGRYSSSKYTICSLDSRLYKYSLGGKGLHVSNFIFSSQPLQICIGPTILIGRESWCLPYAGF